MALVSLAAAAACAVLPPLAHADDPTIPPRNVGGGEANGTVTFDAGREIPPLNAPCAATSFTLSGTSQDFALNTVLTGYAGPVTLAGSGGSDCESADSGAGTLTLTTVTGTGPTDSEIDCANPAQGTTLSGTYMRIGTYVSAVLTGTCAVNHYPAKVDFIFQGAFVPTNGGGGTTAPVSQATFAGAVVVAPNES